MTGTLVASTINAGASAALLLQSNNTTALTLDTSQNVTSAGTVAMASSFKRNRIINGNMLIDQRNAGASVTPTSDPTYTVDRWGAGLSAASKYSVQQSTTAPAGFANSLKITSLSAYSVGVNDYFNIFQVIEGYNFADLNWGSANAKTVTLSFQVYSSLTGTFGGSLFNGAFTRTYPFTYSISSANTWTPVSITISGDTTGTWATGNTGSCFVNFSLGGGTNQSAAAGSWVAGLYRSATGAVSVVGTSGATFYITGVQLEVGTKATPYEMQIYSDQLAQCQRYYQQIGGNSSVGAAAYSMMGSGIAINTITADIMVPLLVSMRTAPTLNTSNTAIQVASTNYAVTSFSSIGTTFNTVWIRTVTGGVFVAGYGAIFSANNNTAGYISMSAEL